MTDIVCPPESGLDMPQQEPVLQRSVLRILPEVAGIYHVKSVWAVLSLIKKADLKDQRLKNESGI